MIIQPFILRSPDGDDGGGPTAAIAAPSLEVKANAGTDAPAGPRPMDRGAPAPIKSRMEMLAEKAGVEAPKPKEKTPANPPLPTPPKKNEVKTLEAKNGEKPVEGASHDPKNGDKPKVNPWKERDKERARADAAEARIREFETNRLKDEDRTILESTRKRNEELENEIRFTKYEASKEFKEKYHQPYEDKLADAMSLFSRIPVMDKASGTQRAGNESDLFELMNLDPVSADARALELSEGKQGLADRMVRHAEQLAETLKARNKALEDAKTNGKTREAEMTAKQQRERKVLEGKVVEWAKETDAEWDKDPDAALLAEIKAREDGKELTPDEVAHNEVIAKGHKLASSLDKTFSQCKTAEEAKELVRERRAAYKRAVHFGALRRLYHRTAKELTAAKAELAKFQATTPTTNGRQLTPTRTGNNGDADRRSRLTKYAGR